MLRPIAGIALAVLLVYSAPSPAQIVPADAGFAAPGAAMARTALRPRNSAIALLNTFVESVDWVETPFEEVIDWLRDTGEGQVNVIPRWTALSVEDVDQDSFVTLKLRNVTVGEVLIEVFEQLVEDNELALRATRNILKISAKTDFGRKLELRIYNVTDIMFRVPNNGEESPNIDLTQSISSGGGGGGGGGQTVFGGGGGGGGAAGGSSRGGDQAEQQLETRLQIFATMLQQAVAPATCAVNGQGGLGTVNTHNLGLIVYNTVEVHEQIAGHFALGE